jgi:predicted DNA-binding transcriptional regulator AlpA
MAIGKLVGITEAARLLGMSVAWVYMHAEGKHPVVPVIRLGRKLKFDPADLEKFLEEQKALSAARRPSRG